MNVCLTPHPYHHHHHFVVITPIWQLLGLSCGQVWGPCFLAYTHSYYLMMLQKMLQIMACLTACPPPHLSVGLSYPRRHLWGGKETLHLLAHKLIWVVHCTPALTHVTVEMYIILVCSVLLLFLCLFLYYHSTFYVHIFIYFLPPPSIVLCKFLHCAPRHDHDDDDGIHYKTDGHHRTIITLPGSVYCWRMQADTDHFDPDNVRHITSHVRPISGVAKSLLSLI